MSENVNHIKTDLEFSSESKLFGGGPPCPRASSATLLYSVQCTSPLYQLHLESHALVMSTYHLQFPFII